MLSVFVLFGEDVLRIIVTLDLFDRYKVLMYNFLNSIISNCYMSEAFGCSWYIPIYASHGFIMYSNSLCLSNR